MAESKPETESTTRRPASVVIASRIVELLKIAVWLAAAGWCLHKGYDDGWAIACVVGAFLSL